MLRWLLASSPLFVLLVTMLWLRWKAKTAGFVAWLVALTVAWAFFGGFPLLLALASAKGVSLTLFVVLIIWSSSFMFQLVSETGSVPVISRWMATLSSDRLMLGLLIGWCLSGVIQAVAGFGVPVAVCAPLMIAAGFEPVVAAAGALVGHAWSITFGSMGSSFYTLGLSTKIPAEILGHWVGLTFIIPTVLTGLAVAHIIDGWKGVRKGFFKILAVGTTMGGVQWIVARAGSGQLAALLGSLAGVLLTSVLAPREKAQGAVESGEESAGGAGTAEGGAARPGNKASGQPDPGASGKTGLAGQPGGQLGGQSLHVALTPYYALLSLTLISQIGPIKAFFKPLKFGIDYPAMVTRQGYEVAAEKAYAAIGLFSHPAPIITAACLVGLIVYLRRGLLTAANVKKAWQGTVKQSWPTTLGVLTMVMMALVMTDTGMTREMAAGVAKVAGALFPLVSPFIGVLGCFMTGSNTNSNVLFGAFQIETANALGISATLVAASQTTGASLGSSIAPAKVLLGSSTSGLTGREAELMKKCLPYCVLIVLALGLQTLVATALLTVVP